MYVYQPQNGASSSFHCNTGELHVSASAHYVEHDGHDRHCWINITFYAGELEVASVTVHDKEGATQGYTAALARAITKVIANEPIEA